MTLDENDYLTYQLYTASKTPRIRKSRVRSWIFIIITFLGLAYLFFVSGNKALAVYFLALTVLSAVLYPFYSRWFYKRHYLKFIRDTYKNRFHEESTLEINEDTIVTKDRTGEVKLNTTEIEAINEIKDYFFIRLKSGMSFIISKVKTDATELEKVKTDLKMLVDKKGIKHNVELDWKWR